MPATEVIDLACATALSHQALSVLISSGCARACDGCTFHRPDLYRRDLPRRPHADRGREGRRARLRGLVRRKRGHGGLLLRQARHRARPADLACRRLAGPHVPRHGREVPHSRPRPEGEARARSPSCCPTTASAPSSAAGTTTISTPSPSSTRRAFRALHLDGHQAEAAIHYAKACREAGVLTSLDGGGVRENTHDLLGFIDVAICAERMAEQMDLTPERLLDYLKSRGLQDRRRHHGRARHALVRRERAWCSGNSRSAVPSSLIVDTSGAGDVFHGSYVFSSMHRPGLTWREHFDFARCASAFKIQHLGNENGLPSLADIERIKAEFREAA